MLLCIQSPTQESDGWDISREACSTDQKMDQQPLADVPMICLDTQYTQLCAMAFDDCATIAAFFYNVFLHITLWLASS